MLDIDAAVQKVDRRDDYKVISYREVGLPLFRLNCAITFQEVGQIGAIEEFMLRALQLEIGTIVEIIQFLGLPEKVVVVQLGQLVFDGLVAVGEGAPPRYAIRPEGVHRLATLASSIITRQRMPVYIDGITRRVVPVDPQDLWTGKELTKVGVSGVTPVQRSVPQPSQIDLSELNRVVKLAARIGSPTQRAVRVDAVVGRPQLLFRRSVAVAFKSTDGRRVALTFLIDGRESEEHEVDYARAGVAKNSLVFASLFEADKRRREIQASIRERRQDIEIDADSGLSASRPVLSLHGREPLKVAQNRASIINVYGHAPLLRKGLEEAKSRLLIISPRVRASVVTPEFIKALTACLARGVKVVVAYGVGVRDPIEREVDKAAKEALDILSRSFENFSLMQVRSPHCKVLLVDDRFAVSTSFNWLSFSGDSVQPMREDEGVLIEDPQIIAAYFDRLIERLDPTTSK